ncbi:hypothetical protein RHSIM_Rhsim02G0070900 [Rhododendron simsii]|uniref:Uncharacterized protein n=1 Tax=Rhododendron simsii TaxID=118357 RepID=A0A834HGY6_RHOSS|nr:hypothetical protein RHSIM_Rhsim02G0070900 [Rhododendron simsii]
MEEGVTSTDVLALQEQRHHETEKRKRDEEIGGKEDSRDSKERVFSKDKGGKEEEKGIITNFISNLLVPRNREAENNEAKDDRMDREGSGKGGCKLEGDLGGGNGGAVYGPPKAEEEMIKLIHHAINSGVTFLDT